MTAGWIRGLFRAAVLVITLWWALVRFFFLSRKMGSRLTARDRALWLQESCRRVLRRLAFVSSYGGPPPKRGLIVSNHLSHLDILFYGATLPCVFVAKSEVRSWPIFGRLASAAGSVFIDRGNAISTAAAARQIEALLAQDLAVLLFPEGTSSDGSGVLRFHSALFEPAIRCAAPITPAAIGYSSTDGVPEKEFCYYGDIRFAPHLLATLSRVGVQGKILFQTDSTIYADRRSAANETWREIVGLRGTPLGDDTNTETKVPVSERHSG